MKIMQIRFQNLNSLLGEWLIDFSHPAYSSDGIFALIGPTGAGKTTVLDAICLALYGRTPRLNRVNKSSNEIMSRHSGFCFAEIHFETREGSYRCHWSQHRARKNPRRELQQHRHEIVDAHSGQVLESKIQDVAALVERITGMNFTRFTRSIMLAQGEFAAFLQAPADERAPILEQITGTEIYSEISIKVHERQREEKNHLDFLQAEMIGIKLLSYEEEEDLRQGIISSSEREKEQQNELKDLRAALDWLDRIGLLEDENELIEGQWQQYIKRQEAFQEEALRLEKARQAMQLEVPYVQLKDLRDAQKNNLKEIEQIRGELPSCKEASGQAEGHGENIRQELNILKKLRQSEGEIARKVREMDILLQQQGQMIAGVEMAIAGGKSECEVLQIAIANGEEELREIGEELLAIEEYQCKNAPDAILSTNLSGIKQLIKALEEKHSGWQQKKLVHEQAALVLQSLQDSGKEIAAAHANNEKLQKHQYDQLQAERNKKEKLLQGKEITWWREELLRLKEEGDDLQKLLQQGDRIARLEDKMRGERKEIHRLDTLREQLLSAIEQGEKEAGHLAVRVNDLETCLLLQNRIRDLETERAQLEDGQACPLCGATEHPYARGNIPQMDEYQQELSQAREHYEQVKIDLKKQEIELGQLDKESEYRNLAIEQDEQERDKEIALHHGTMEKMAGELSLLKSREGLELLATQSQENSIKHTQSLKRIEDLEKRIEELDTSYEKSRSAFLESEKKLQENNWQQDQARMENERLRGEQQDLEKGLEELRQKSLQEINPYGFNDLPWEELASIPEVLQERKNSWERQEREKQGLENRRGELLNEVKQKQVLLGDKELALQAEHKRLGQQQEQYTKQQEARFELYARRDPDEEEARMDTEIAKAEDGLNEALKDLQERQRYLQRLEDREEGLKMMLESQATKLKTSEEGFVILLQQCGFGREESYLQARLSSLEQQSLEQKSEKLKKEGTELQARLRDQRERLRLEKEKQVSEQDRELLEEKQQLAEQDLAQIREKIGVARKALADSEENRRLMQAQLQRIEAGKKELQRWQLLHDLIGSADGKKYRNFAQGLSFDIMIKHANRHLQKMSDRYILIRSQEQALELNIMDNYQAGEIRSTANLSGGESFLVSLALALGLSQMASRQVSVDSLFLDEGFGALDEDVLDSALNTLAGLQQEGKLIGVISHVRALQERISTQIEVKPQSGGRSILQGPGCTRL